MVKSATAHGVIFLIVASVLFCVNAVAEGAQPSTCTYEYYSWNVARKAATDFRRINRPYEQLKAEERDPATGCSVCVEDQELIEINGIEPFMVCRNIAGSVREILSALVARGETINRVVGYRPSKTRGNLDSKGNRTGFSNHSFGLAIDINPDRNGLYDNCTSFGKTCRLVMGGQWKPGRPGTLEGDGPIVKAFKKAGFKWGGEIAGRQKDFMHFSPTGY